MEQSYVIEMNNITKIFDNIVVNDGICLDIKKGEIHALLGENGAGKTTLMCILSGLYQPDCGVIKKDGKQVTINNPNVANELGIGMVHQHFKLVECFTVLENIILGDEPTKKGILQKKFARKKVLELSQKYGLPVELDAKIEDISIGMQQRTEILKILYRDNDILIFDEPTAFLTSFEINDFLNILKKLANEGKSIIFITHKLEEIMKIADRCSVLRKGEYIGTVDMCDMNAKKLASMMVGRDVNLHVKKDEAKPSDIVLSVRNLSIPSKTKGKNIVNNVSFDIRKGEIVSIAGIDGNGQSELVLGLTGIKKVSDGKILLNNKDITNEKVKQRTIDGMSHIPEDMYKYGLVLDYSLENNLILQKYNTNEFVNKFGILKRNRIRNYAKTLIEKFDIRSINGPLSKVRNMSGGNQQKIIIARQFDLNSDLLIAMLPTRGLDVGAIETIHEQLILQRDKGIAILLVSFELDEIMDLSDRILVMFEGSIIGEYDTKNVTRKEIAIYMSGAKK